MKLMPIIESPPVAARTDFLAAMRCVAWSVTVVTTDGVAGRHGATVSAFSSLSADPPSVLICLKSGTRIEKAVGRNGVFGVNILPENGCDLARRFAGDLDAILADRFEDIDIEPVESCGPRLSGATYLNCFVLNKIAHASHTIVIGLVRDLSIAHSAPLTYMDGDFHYVQRQARRLEAMASR